MFLVVNEWMIEYLCPGTEKDRIAELNRFIEILIRNDLKMIIGRTNPFTKKFYKYWKNYENNSTCRSNFKRLFNLMRDSNKTIIIEDDELGEIPQEISNEVPEDDQYLVKLAASALILKNDPIIITTDNRLVQALNGKSSIRLSLLTDFIKDRN
jgi:hypothetical protein